MKRTLNLFCLLVLLILTFAFPTQTSSQGQTVLKILPAVTEIEPSATAVVAVYVENVEDLFSFDIWVSYDPNQLTVSEESLQLGPFLAPGSILIKAVDEENGTVNFVMTRMGFEIPAVSGSGVLFSFEITARNNIGEGSLVILEQAINPRLSTRDGFPIPHTLEHGAVRVLGAVGDRYNTTSVQALTVSAPGVLINDTLPIEGSILVELVDDLPAGEGTLIWPGSKDGGFTYQPKGFSGETGFTYRACLEGGSCYGPVSVEIQVEDAGNENLIYLPLILKP